MRSPERTVAEISDAGNEGKKAWRLGGLEA
jgi:hypothetical protein